MGTNRADDSRDGFDVDQWLEAVDLPGELAEPGTEVSRLSGGQAQRLAVARTLASGQRIVFLDEPSVGLDPLRVVGLADLIRRQCIAGGVAMLVVTHDIQFACHVADRLMFLDPEQRSLVPVLEGEWPGPLESPDSPTSLEWRGRVERAVYTLLDKKAEDDSPAATGGKMWRMLRSGLGAFLGSFLVPTLSLLSIPSVMLRYLKDVKTVFARVLWNAVVRPLPFYAIVSVLLGYTILYVIGRAMPEGLRVSKAVELVGGSYILALTPPICAFLFVATSGSAINAWLGSMGLTRQISALEALGISREKYLWVPGWIGMTLAF